MIKVNVLVSNKSWKKLLGNPEVYLKRKINLLNKKNVFLKKKINFSLLLSNNSEIKKINKKFRKKNKITDILSFPFYEKKELKKLLKKNHEFYLGDIILNLDKIIDKSNNKEKIKDNLDKLWIHGLSHLLGYRHRLNKDYIKMKKIEKKFYNSVN